VALRLFLRASWGSAILGALVVAWLAGTLPRSFDALYWPYFLAGHLGIVCWSVAVGVAVLGQVGPRPMLIGHTVSGVGLALCFLTFALAGVPEALALVPGVFALGQLPVLWHLLQRRSGRMS
jgi:hypothetical protein